MTPPGDGARGSGSAPQGVSGSRPIAAFDFDGTLTVSDSFTAFLRWRTGPFRLAAGLLRLAPAALVYLFTRDRGRLKAASVRVFLRGVGQTALEAQAEAFCAARAYTLLRPDALAAWDRHGAHGDVRVIVTASPETLVRPFAERLGADVLIGTRLRFDGRGRVDGALDGANCRGEQKLIRLRQRFGEGVQLAYAYGDTAGDRELLAFAERGRLKLFRGRPGRRVSPV